MADPVLCGWIDDLDTLRLAHTRNTYCLIHVFPEKRPNSSMPVYMTPDAVTFSGDLTEATAAMGRLKQYRPGKQRSAKTHPHMSEVREPEADDVTYLKTSDVRAMLRMFQQGKANV